jgi:diphosphomevalonate decarboxylase
VPQAYAHTNIALVKYWGKREGVSRELNLPAVGSLSLTLDKFGTSTSVAVDVAQDRFVLDGSEAAPEDSAKVFRFLDALAGPERKRAAVTSRNDVPTAAGLASSASGFAALALAAAHAYDVGWKSDARALSQWARRGSGSAARSIAGGFVVQHRGSRTNGEDCFAEALESKLEVRLVVVRCAIGRKKTASTDGMNVTAQTSPYYRAWLDTHERDLDEARAAVERGDLERLGSVMEHNTMKMHASALAANPWVLYWNGTTLDVLDELRSLRKDGTGAWATMDAGPHVKILCAPNDAEAIATRMKSVDGVVGVDVCAPGPAARIVA